ncbi:MAG: pyruvate kinase [Candidatus Glassbacteria bacterium]
MRKTKIICTLGPSSREQPVIERLIAAGMDAARINFSHGDHESNRKVYNSFRQAADKAGRPLPIVGDLQGPRIRVGEIEGGMELAEGRTVVLSSENEPAQGNRIGTTYRSLARDVSPGVTVLLNDGLLRLVVEKVEGADVHCRVIAGGRLTSHKGINLPEVAISEPSLTEKDRADLKFLTEEGFDFVALSFVQRAEDVREAKKIIADSGSSMKVISKIEKPSALDCLDEILDESDGVIVARGDLGVELGVERVPAAQKKILRACSRRNVLSVTATQLLESMSANPVPTRAEASDVANAVFDGTDSLLFTGETAAGKYPVETVATADRIVREAESSMDAWGDVTLLRHQAAANFPEAVCHAAVDAARDLGASAIVVGSQSGRTALLVSKFKPPMPVVGISDDDRALRRMNLYCGVIPLKIPRMEVMEESIAETRHYLIGKGYCKPGDVVVMTFGVPLPERRATNTLRLVEI